MQDNQQNTQGSSSREIKLLQLIHDLNCPDPDKMFIPELAERVRYFKQTKEGQKEMSDWFANYENIAIQRTKENIAVNLIKLNKLTLEEIAQVTELTLNDVQSLAQTLKP
ncbi:MAG: hypothetical protein IJP48_02655 [Synergistaceae bacterium]|nr:hypothetical protein [Synergistaceae bacterium]